jgi:alkylation response protein AidB-like acyl-CoA dehydrogenase
MFTMMNYMRLGVGVQGMGVAERSYQRCVAFARERLQGKAPASAVASRSSVTRTCAACCSSCGR